MKNRRSLEIKTSTCDDQRKPEIPLIRLRLTGRSFAMHLTSPWQFLNCHTLDIAMTICDKSNLCPCIQVEILISILFLKTTFRMSRRNICMTILDQKLYTGRGDPSEGWLQNYLLSFRPSQGRYRQTTSNNRQPSIMVYGVSPGGVKRVDGKLLYS